MPKLVKNFNFPLFLLVAIAIAVILRVINLGSREFWYDEVLSLLLSTGQKSLYHTPKNVPVEIANYQSLFYIPIENSLGDIINTAEKFLKGLVAEPHPPLFYIGQHLWLRLFGNSEAAMRSLPALYSIGAIGCAYSIGRYLLGHRGGLLFSALLALNPFYLFHSLNVRMYSSLVFWTLLSGWALLETGRKESKPKKIWFWSLILICSVTAGFMTFYYFLFWVASLGVLVLLWDRQRWWHHAIRLSIGVLIPTPWLLWGTRQQLNNADLGRFAAGSDWLETISKHLEGILNALAPQLIWGDWVTSLPSVIIILSGIVAIALLIAVSIHLWQTNHQQLLLITLCFGIVPLLMMVGLDVVSGKFTVGFGWGRALIFILPGCLLLITTWLIKAAGKWQQLIVVSLLVFYLCLNVSDYNLRSRQMFHQVANTIKQQSETPTLIAMDSKAWGNVLRVVYYLPSKNVSLLADSPSGLSESLPSGLKDGTYPRLIWLHSHDPVWSRPKTEADKLEYFNNIKAAIPPNYKLIETQELLGTMSIDKFTARTYQLTGGGID